MKMNPRDFLKLLKSKAESQPADRSLEEKRADMEEVCARFPVPQGVALETMELGGVPCIRQSPSDAMGPHILYFHGGGYISGSPRTHLVLTAALAKQARATVWSVDYRLAPEDPFPAAVEDAVAAYSALLERVGSPESIVISGDSAGGGLSITSMLKARAEGLAMPAGIAIMSPFVDLTCSGWSNAALSNRDFLAEPDTLAEMSGNYVGDADPRDPLISPIHADLSGLPNMLIHVGSEEALLSDSTRLAERAGAAGIAIDLKIWPDMPHVFQLYGKFLNAADDSVVEIAEWVAQHTSQA